MRVILKAILNVILRIVYRVKIIGKENIPKEGAYIICGNHIHALDAASIVLTSKRKIVFMVKAELYKNPILKFLGTTFGMIPVKRGKQDLDAMKQSLKVLNNKQILGIFPEGTRKGMAKNVKVKNGASYMALRTNTPVIPVGVKGSFKPFTRITLNYGKPLNFEEYSAKNPEKEALDKVTADIMDNIIRLTNES